MIRSILFDFDGVLTLDDSGSQSILNYLSGRTGISLSLLEDAYYKYNTDLLDGRLTHRDIWADFCAQIGMEIDFALLTDSFIHTPIDTDMLAYAAKLHGQYRLAMVTDNKADRMNTICSHYHLNELFDVVAVSATFHSGKAHPEIFVDTLRQLNCLPAECIFIDNTASNLTIPGQMGIHTILFDDRARDLPTLQNEIHTLTQ